MIGFLPYITLPMSLSMEIAGFHSPDARIIEEGVPINVFFYYDRPVVVFNEQHKPHLGYLHRSLNLVNAINSYIIIPPFYSKIYISNGNKMFGAGAYTFHVDLTTDNIGDFSEEMATYYTLQKNNNKNGN